MAEHRVERFDQIVKMGKEGQLALNDYWRDFALYTSFEYFFMVVLLIGPLMYLFFKIDKNKIFLMGFYGYSIHVTFTYVDLYGKNHGFWNYPFPVIPSLPGIALDSSLIPVIFMLVYQWTLNRNKNYYLYTMITSAILSFIFKPLLVSMGLFKLYGSIGYLHLFVGYFFVLVIAKLITNVFLWMQKKYGNKR